MTENRSHTVALLTSIRSRRSAVAARRQLAAELATFSTASDRIELDAILERADEREADYVRSILIGMRARHAA